MPSLHVDGVEIFYAEAGSGDPLLMVHGTLGDQRSFARVMEPLAARYHVVAISLRHCWPGSWPSAAVGGVDFSIGRHVADIVEIIEKLGGGPVNLFGHSRGGHIAFRVAERHPALLRALILAEPGGVLDETLGGSSGDAGRQVAVFSAAATLIAAGDIDGGLRRLAENSGGPGAFERFSERRKSMQRDNARTLIGQASEGRMPYSRAAAASIRTPTLLLNGADTRPSFIATVEALARVMPDARRVIIPDATHGLITEQPALVAAAVLEFLAAGGAAEAVDLR
jgi:esterase